MKRVERIGLINKIVNAMNKFDDLDTEHYFGQITNDYGTDIRVYYGEFNYGPINTKASLQKLNDNALKEIAEEFKIEVDFPIKTPPVKWSKNSEVKAFISHASQYKREAQRLSECLKKYNISGFVAHEDITPTVPWLREIDKALNSMDFFISLHTPEFTKSIYCQQEVGYALAKGTKIIPVKFTEEIPCGFISEIQALPRGTKKAEELVSDIVNILKDDPKTSKLYTDNIASFFEEDLPF